MRNKFRLAHKGAGPPRSDSPATPAPASANGGLPPKTKPPLRISRWQGWRGLVNSTEAPTGVEPVMEVLQTSALPLGYGAGGAVKSLPARGSASLRDPARGEAFLVALLGHRHHRVDE